MDQQQAVPAATNLVHQEKLYLPPFCLARRVIIDPPDGHRGPF